MSYFDRTKLTNDTGVVVNPAQDETVILLRRLVKIMESQAVVDNQMRQRVTVDVMPTTTITVSSGTVSNISALGGIDSRWQIIDWSRQAYNSGIRSNLINS